MSSSYQELTVWQKSVELAVLIYKVTQKFPRNELYGLISQIRRSAIAIASNIAEGQGRRSSKEFCQFLRIAFSSTLELETQIIIASKVNYLELKEKDYILSSCLEIKKMIKSLEKSLN